MEVEFNFLSDNHVSPIVVDGSDYSIRGDREVCMEHGAQHLIMANIPIVPFVEYIVVKLYLNLQGTMEDDLFEEASDIVVDVVNRRISDTFGPQYELIAHNCIEKLIIGFRSGESFSRIIVREDF